MLRINQRQGALLGTFLASLKWSILIEFADEVSIDGLDWTYGLTFESRAPVLFAFKRQVLALK